MKEKLHQGDIIKVDDLNVPVLVVSKDFFNQEDEIIGCPIFKSGEAGPLHIKICGDKIKGIVHCEKLKLLDLNVRGYATIDRIHMPAIIDITDAIQGIFDYV